MTRQHYHPRRSSALPSPLIGPAIVLAVLAGVFGAYLLAAWWECGSADASAMCALAAVPARRRWLLRLRMLPAAALRSWYTWRLARLLRAIDRAENQAIRVAARRVRLEDAALHVRAELQRPRGRRC